MSIDTFVVFNGVSNPTAPYEMTTNDSGVQTPELLSPPTSDPDLTSEWDYSSTANLQIVRMINSTPAYQFPQPIPPSVSEFSIGTFILRNFVHRIPSYPSVYINKAGQRFNRGTMTFGLSVEQMSNIR